MGLRYVKIFLVMLLILLSTTACGYKDIDKRSFVLTIAVDKGQEKKYKVMLKIAIPSSDVRGQKPEFIISEQESDTITDAIRMIKTKVDKELDFSHAKSIIFGEEIVAKDVSPLLDWFIRRRDIQKIAWVGIGSPTAESIITIKRKIERLPSNALFMSFGQTGTESVYIVSEFLFDFRKRITEKGLDPILPILEPKSTFFQINKAAVFGDKKLKITLSEDETKILNMLLQRVNKADIEVKKEDTEEPFFFVSAEGINSGIEIHSSDKVEVKIKMQGVIEEAVVEVSEENLKKYKKLAEEQFKEKVLSLLWKFQEEEVDPVGFGLLYRAKSFDKDDWEQWQKLYPNVKFDVQVELQLHGTGLLK
ncbi:spore germination protein KC [Salirhabdus euzebyi]|uniref:Spore germination protein KC n=1 Tax=Salirhabdus euzebyi TaxID=394506 RepID=A0A841Q219_9BACI|nr:Ger(x)C family spore germination protein [Salirhabdus euzebyi]MBB6452583.1 spore germination protein KC [Salirhabdus euzebyi]